MASTYPSVTAAQKKKIVKDAIYPKPSTVKKVNNMMMGFLSPQAAARIALAKVPAKFRFKPDPLALLKAINIPEAALSPTTVKGPSIRPRSEYWDFACWGSGSQFRTGNNLFTCGFTFQKDEGINVSGWAPFTPDRSDAIYSASTSRDFIGLAKDIGDYAGHPDPKFRMFEITMKGTRKVGAPIPTPVWEAVPSILTVPEGHPAELPLAWPIANPTVRPASPVWEAPAIGDEPSADPKPEPKPKKGTPIPFPGYTAPLVLPNPGFPVIRITPGQDLPFVPVFPGVIVEPVTGGDYDSGTWYPPVAVEAPIYGKPEYPKPSPGGGGRKVIHHKAETKFQAAIGLTWAGINTVTEAMDFIVAMHKSLPKAYRLSPKASKAQVLEYMLSNPDVWFEIDLAEGIENFINMQISDMAAALGSTAIKKTNQGIGSTTGLDRIIREHGDALGDLDPESNDNWTDLIPTLDIDAETGVISVTGPMGVLRLKKSWFTRR